MVLNILNLVVFLKTKAKSTTLSFLLLLAIFDLAYLILAAPMSLIRCLPQGAPWQVWTSGVYEIWIYLPLVNFSATSSNWLTVVLTVDRYVHIKQSERARRAQSMAKRWQRLTIIFIIFGSVAINTPYIFYKTMDEDGHVVDSEFAKTTSFQVYTWIRMASIKLVPVLVVALCNALLTKVLVDMSRKRKALGAPFSAQARLQHIQVGLLY